ncbi:decaprenyl-phosphate phosphoribosyltransferase [Leekyejoonella antrihumi]|uniref:decaprenyl-phosphate phosphoribosyltransferase n=1 Tax=Leekyejoonella antrihumi TaxID=1660198 RepID=UPI0016477527|nr:decaprenyl-phosphate phosphoribosyltransferase [Leekyejoonella antrihumi]
MTSSASLRAKRQRPGSRRSAARALLSCSRPRQWTKNLLVLIAPMAAGVITHPAVLLRLLIALVAFTLASSAVYLVNDLLDLSLDRAHPIKRNRPLASGRLPVPVARNTVPILAVLAVGVAALGGWALAGIVVLYLASSMLYCARLKHETVLDLVFVVIGFLLRAIGGGIAAQVPVSRWFVLTVGLGALFVIAGKRYAELVLVQRGLSAGRPVLRQYSASYLRFVWTLAAAALLVTYALWSFTVAAGTDSATWSVVSILPFVVVLLRYAVIVDAGGAGEPEEIVLGDRMLLGTAVVWLVLLVAAVYV